MTTEVVTITPQAPLLDLVRKMIDARADRAIVIDELDRPIGIVSATDTLEAIAVGGGGDSGAGNPVVAKAREDSNWPTL